jgi:DNA recombination protein RmuC
VKNFNGFTNSFNGRLMVTGRKFRDLNIETGARDLEDVSSIDALALGEGPALIEKPETADV